MELKQRLATLRRERGETLSSEPASSTTPATPTSVGQRLQRLYGKNQPETTRETDEEQVARLLDGTRLAEGLIVVERQIPLPYQHGNRRLAARLTQADFATPVGQPQSIEHLIFMDTETTGLAGGTGTIAFLLGLARITGDILCLRQFFLTGFRGEAALLQAAKAWVENADHLVTFNGKSFDAPLMSTRYRLAGIRDPFAEMHHLDLIHPTRRAFGSQWPDCRLQTAEQRLFGFQRHDDLPAYLVPEVWFAFIRHGITRRLPGLLMHNRWDLTSLVALLPSLTEAFATPRATGADVVAVARYWLQRGEEQTALAHLRDNQNHLTVTGQLELARLYRRRQAWESAVPIWHRLADYDCLEALERLAKYYEHVQRDLSTALDLTHRLRHLDRHNSSHIQREQRLKIKLSRSATSP